MLTRILQQLESPYQVTASVLMPCQSAYIAASFSSRARVVASIGASGLVINKTPRSPLRFTEPNIKTANKLRGLNCLLIHSIIHPTVVAAILRTAVNNISPSSL